jgi:hypothetical protein
MDIHAGIFLQSFEVSTLEMFGSLLAETLFFVKINIIHSPE